VSYFRLIESYDATATIELQGARYPRYSLIEDDRGIRILLAPGPIIPPHIANQAALASTAMTMYPEGDLWVHTIDEGVWIGGPSSYVQITMSIWGLAEQRRLDSFRHAFVNVHTHSEFSALDGLSKVQELVDLAVKYNQPALALTDHGKCAGHTELQTACDKAGIKPVPGIEAYWVENRLDRTNQWGYNHLILWAQSDQGLLNLWGASTEANKTGLYRYPRMDWEILERFSDGLVASTACLRGPLMESILKDDYEGAKARLARFMQIFPDRLYVELHCNTLPDQLLANKALVQLAHEFSLPLIAAVDSHYPCAGDYQYHQLWLEAQMFKKKSEKEDKEQTLFAGHQQYHLMTREEVRSKLSYLPEWAVEQAIDSTWQMAESCNAHVPTSNEPPIFSVQYGRQYAIDHLRTLCEANWARKIKAETPEYRERFEFEMQLLEEKKFCDYYLIVADYVRAVKKEGKLVGPGRGSGAASLVAYLSDITEIDPVKFDLLFSRFMTKGRVDLPDFDLDFGSSTRAWLQHYVAERWGFNNVARVGSHMRLKNKGAFRDMGRVLQERIGLKYGDIDIICAIIDEEEASSAGLGYDWAVVHAANEIAFAPYELKYPLLFEMVDKMVTRLKSYGKHASGMVISTGEPLVGRLPMRAGDEDQMVTELDYRALEAMGYPKFDLLTTRTLDTLQMCIELIHQRRGVLIDPVQWDHEYDDPQVWDNFCDGNTLGVFQFETRPMTALTKRMQPRTIVDLADINALVRPGPRDSGLTETYMRRREGREDVEYPNDQLTSILKSTLGTFLYQEQVMGCAQILAGYDDVESDKLRKLLGKKLIKEAEEAGRKFVNAAVDHGADRTNALLIWDQLVTFAKYGFNKCVLGTTEVSLAGANASQGNSHTVEWMYRRLHTEMLPPTVGRPARGAEYAGPCLVCGATEAHHWIRGWCNACYVWRQKFLRQGVYGLSYYADDRIRPARIIDVVESGVQPVWKITLANGKSITSTANHRHLSEYGFAETDVLKVGDRLVVDGGYEVTVYEPSMMRLTKGEKQRVGSIRGGGEANWNYTDGGWMFWKHWKETHEKVCAQCGTNEGRIEVAHLDGDHAHNVEGNLAWLCVSCHKAYDYAHNDRRRRWQKGHAIVLSEIITIEYAGEHQTYDVVMDAPHNFVANGIVTHNSHAVAYSVQGFWCAWFKTHYPEEFYTACLSTVDQSRVPEFVSELQRTGFKVLPPDINESKSSFTPSPMAVRYGLLSIHGVGEKSIHPIIANQPFSSFEDFRERIKGTSCDRGTIRTLASVGAFDSLEPNRKALEVKLEAEFDGSFEVCKNMDRSVSIGTVNNLPCTYDWAHEPVEFTPTGKAKRRKDPPKRCTKGCRNYDPVGMHLPSIEPYTDEEVRNREIELLGVWLSSTPFDVIADEDRKGLLDAEQLERAPNGGHITVGIVKKIKPIVTKTGQSMAFLSVLAQTSDVDVTVFSDNWAKYRPILKVGAMGLYYVVKNNRGLVVQSYVPIS
jgi:DNA polymerase-3 subunit alpha